MKLVAERLVDLRTNFKHEPPGLFVEPSESNYAGRLFGGPKGGNHG